MPENFDDHLHGAIFDAATGYETVVQELIVELVKNGALREAQAAKILLRAEGVIARLDYPESNLHRFAVEKLTRSVRERLALQPVDFRLRRLGRKVRDAHQTRRRKRR